MLTILLVLDDFKFQKCTISKNGIKWRCAIKLCTSNFLCDEGDVMTVVDNSLKRKATE